MATNFTGTNTEWKKELFGYVGVPEKLESIYVASDNIQICIVNGNGRSKEETLANADLICEAGNVRQKINCSLTELLNQRNELLENLSIAFEMLKDSIGVDDIQGLVKLAKMKIAIERATNGK